MASPKQNSSTRTNPTMKVKARGHPNKNGKTPRKASQLRPVQLIVNNNKKIELEQVKVDHKSEHQ